MRIFIFVLRSSSDLNIVRAIREVVEARHLHFDLDGAKLASAKYKGQLLFEVNGREFFQRPASGVDNKSG